MPSRTSPLSPLKFSLLLLLLFTAMLSSPGHPKTKDALDEFDLHQWKSALITQSNELKAVSAEQWDWISRGIRSSSKTRSSHALAVFELVLQHSLIETLYYQAVHEIDESRSSPLHVFLANAHLMPHMKKLRKTYTRIPLERQLVFLVALLNLPLDDPLAIYIRNDKYFNGAIQKNIVKRLNRLRKMRPRGFRINDRTNTVRNIELAAAIQPGDHLLASHYLLEADSKEFIPHLALENIFAKAPQELRATLADMLVKRFTPFTPEDKPAYDRAFSREGSANGQIRAILQLVLKDTSGFSAAYMSTQNGNVKEAFADFDLTDQDPRRQVLDLCRKLVRESGGIGVGTTTPVEQIL